MSEEDAAAQWTAERTTFQRVYDVLAGVREYESAAALAERAACSESGARRALEQLVEMGVAQRRDGRPRTYRRNDAYFEWKRVESLASEHDSETLQSRLSDLLTRDSDLQERFGVPDPDAVTSDDLDADDIETAWETLSEWRTVRRDIKLLKKAVQRAEAGGDGAVRA